MLGVERAEKLRICVSKCVHACARIRVRACAYVPECMLCVYEFPSLCVHRLLCVCGSSHHLESHFAVKFDSSRRRGRGGGGARAVAQEKLSGVCFLNKRGGDSVCKKLACPGVSVPYPGVRFHSDENEWREPAGNCCMEFGMGSAAVNYSLTSTLT